MCGRFTITVTMDELKDYLSEYYDIQDVQSDFEVPRYNVAPGQEVVSIINDGTKNRVGLLRWGLIPSFAKDEKSSYATINAKAETLHEKPSFKGSFEHKRCIILADGFYEWKKGKDQKQPLRILMKDKKIFPIAGLWSTFTKDDGSKLYTTTIITTKSNELMADIHDRMPVILSEDNKKTWLDPHVSDLNQLRLMLKPYEPTLMYAYPVSNIVNSSKNDIKECIKQVI